MENHDLKPLSEVYNTLAKRGITEEFCMNDKNEMRLGNNDKMYEPEELCIVKSYRFEGDSNPEDNSVLYLIKDHDGKLGTLLDSYGAESNYSGEHFDNFIRKIPIQEDAQYDLG